MLLEREITFNSKFQLKRLRCIYAKRIHARVDNNWNLYWLVRNYDLRPVPMECLLRHAEAFGEKPLLVRLAIVESVRNFSQVLEQWPKRVLSTRELERRVPNSSIFTTIWFHRGASREQACVTQGTFVFCRTANAAWNAQQCRVKWER